jgi:autotransporter-associated beta strand protein
VNLGTNAQVVLGDAVAISLGNNATITVAGGVLVQNVGVSNSFNGPYGLGPNTIEFNNNSRLTVQAGGTVYASGPSTLGQAVNPNGSGNVIDNFGTIRADHTAPISFNSGFNRNTVINEAGGVIQASSPTATAIKSNGSAIDFTNMGTVIGSLVFSGHGADTFNAVTGSSVTGTIDGGSGTGNNTLTLSGSGSGVMSSVIANWSSVIKTDSGTWTLTANNTYTGATNINAGILIVNGSIASSSVMTVNSGVAILGTGTLGSTVINSGDFLVPGNPSGTLPITGNSPGTLTISGNLALQSGAFYVVQVTPTTASSTNVSGTASLAGTVGGVFAPGSYVTRSYTILTAAGGVTGTFDAGAVRGLPAGFRPSLTYTPNTVVLNLLAQLVPSSPTTPPTTVVTMTTTTTGATTATGSIVLTTLPSGPGLFDGSSTETQPSQPPPLPNFTTNQLNAGLAINNFFNNGGALPPAFVSLYNLTGSNLTNALDQLSGEPVTGAQKVAFQLTDQFLNVMLDPFVDGRSGVGGADHPALGFAPEREAMPADIALAYAKVFKEPPAPMPVYEPRWTAWGGAYGGSNRTSGDLAVTGSHDLSARTAGFTSGLDYRVTPDTVVGFALAGGGTGWSLANNLGSGKSDAFQAGVYGATKNGPAYLAAAFAFANHWMSTDRVAVADHLFADFNAQSYGGRVEGGYRFGMSYGGITPYAAIQAQSFHTPGITETDGIASGFALAFGSRDATDTRSELGARFDRVLTVYSNAVLALRARVAWAHDRVSDPTLLPVFEALPGAGSFIVNGATPAKNSALTSAGAELRLANGVTLLGKFDGDFASHSTTYAGTGAIRYRW